MVTSINANDPFDIDTRPLPYASGDDVYRVTPSDTTDLPVAARALRAVVAGTIAVYTRGSASSATVRTLTFAAGETQHVRVIRILATGTTATTIDAYV